MQSPLKFKLSLLGISCPSLSSFTNGFLLYDLLLSKLPNTSDLLKLKSRLKSPSPDKPNQKANQVVNLNILLKYLRKELPDCPKNIQELSVFDIIDKEEKMRELVEWVVGLEGGEEREGNEDSLNESDIKGRRSEEDSSSKYNLNQHAYRQTYPEQYYNPSQCSPLHSQQDYSPLKSHQTFNQRDTELTNLYYVNEKQNYQNNYPDEDISLNIPKEQVLKVKSRSSIKIIKPRASFDNHLDNNNNDSFFSHQQTPITHQHIEKVQKLSLPPRPNIPPLPKQQHKEKIDESSIVYSKQFQKSTPKMVQRNQGQQVSGRIKKPFEKSFDNSSVKVSTTSRTHRHEEEKMETSSVKNIREFPLYQKNENLSNNANLNKIRELQKEVELIEKSIGKEKKDIVTIKRSNKSLQKKPMQVEQISKANKQSIVQWLVNINLLNSLVRSKINDLPKICKKGVIFPQLINQKKQRSDPEIKYQGKPTKSAEIHANYRRVFDYLSQLNNFSSNFLYAYENFIPEINENVFWGFMLELMNYYKGVMRKKSSSVAKVGEEGGEKPAVLPVKTEREDYEKIRFSLQHKTTVNSTSNSNSKPALPPKRKPINDDSDEEIHERHLMHKKIEQNIIAQSRIDTNNSFVSLSSYQQIRLKKQILSQTPRRQHSFKKPNLSSSSSLAKNKQLPQSLKNSKIFSSTDNQPTEFPQTTQQMQRVSTSYLKSQFPSLDIQNLLNFKEMFNDPVRNGTLLMLIVCKQFNLKAQEFIVKPGSINDCKLNLTKALTIIKEKVPGFPAIYLNSIEQILKGNKSIFYNIIFHIVNKTHLQQPQQQLNSLLKADISFNNNINQSHSFQNLQQYKASLFHWIQSLKPSLLSMRHIEITSFESILQHMSTGILLNDLASLITKRNLKLVYDKPQYHVQYRANIMKILEALIEKEVVEKECLWKAKKISVGDIKTIVGLLEVIKGKMGRARSGSISNGMVPFQELIRAYCTK